ncbi:hypothetical protein J4219_06170 [Candidatus Woesearchaeota archaeon]|nr:hypothetical protein [Candidatus Woesearchaeota archaeon]
MLTLQKTTDAVKEEIEQDLYLLDLLKQDLINVSALARQFLPKIKKENPKATPESIFVAIKRYVETTKKESVSESMREILAGSKLYTTNDVVHATLKRNNEVSRKLAEISKLINWEDDEVFFVNQGSGEITVILDMKNSVFLKDLQKYEIERTENLTIISVRETLQKGKPRSIDVPGVYAYFMNRLSRKSINIIAVTSTYTQVTFAFNKNDFIRAYETLQQSIDYFRKRTK